MSINATTPVNHWERTETTEEIIYKSKINDESLDGVTLKSQSEQGLITLTGKDTKKVFDLLKDSLEKKHTAAIKGFYFLASEVRIAYSIKKSADFSETLNKIFEVLKKVKPDFVQIITKITQDVINVDIISKKYSINNTNDVLTLIGSSIKQIKFSQRTDYETVYDYDLFSSGSGILEQNRAFMEITFNKSKEADDFIKTTENKITPKYFLELSSGNTVTVTGYYSKYWNKFDAHFAKIILHLCATHPEYMDRFLNFGKANHLLSEL